MAEVQPKMSLVAVEEVIMGFLFGEEIRCLGSDGFEGSEEERQICMNVLYDMNIRIFNNSSSKMVNFQSNECSLSKQTGDVNAENFVHANPSSLNDTSVIISRHDNLNNKDLNDILASKRCHLQTMITSYSRNGKCLKMSSSDPSQLKDLVTTIRRNGNDLLNCCPLQISDSLTSPYSLTAHPKPQCSQSCVVESIGHNVLTSCSFDNFQILSSGCGDSGTMLSKNELTNQDGSRDEVHIEPTSRSPNSKESRASPKSKHDLSIVVQQAFKGSECADQRENEIPDPGSVEGSVGMPSDVDFSVSTPSLAVLSERVAEENVLKCSMEDLQTHRGSHPVNQKCKESNAPDLGNVVLVQASTMKCVSPFSNSLDLQSQQSTELDVPVSGIITALVETSTATDIPAQLSSQQLQGKIATVPNTSVLSIAHASLEPFSSRDLTLKLRSHACHLLKDAGWIVQTRQRENSNRKSQFDSHYRSPDGRIFHSLSKAWVACGSRLLASTPNAGPNDETERVWVHINEFWADLANILVEVKEKIQGLGKYASLLLQWYIFDPFMAVVCIDKKLTALKHGMVVKAARSEAIILSNSKSLSLASKGVENKNHSSPGNLSHTVQPVFSDSRLEVTGCSSGKQVLPLHGLQGLKRKRRHMKLVHGTSYDEHSCNKNLGSPSRCLTEAMVLHGRKQNPSSVSDIPVQEAMILDGSSKPDYLNPFENSSFQAKGMYCSPTEKSNIDSDSFNESRNDRLVHSKDTPCSSMNAGNQNDKFGSFNVFGDGIRRALSFQESDEIGGGSYFKATDATCNTHGRNEELGEVGQQTRTDSGKTGNIFTVNPAHELPAVDQNMLLFKPKQKAICFNQDGHCRQELVGSFVSPCDLEVNVQQEIQSCFCQSSSLHVDHPSGLSPPHNTDFPSQEGIIDFSSRDDHLIEKLAMHGILNESGCPEDGNEWPTRSEIRKINPEKQTTSIKKQTSKRSTRTSEVQLSKITVKKSKNNIENEVTRKTRRNAKKISGLDATEENANGLTSILSDANCIYLFPYSMNHCKNDSPHPNHWDVINLTEKVSEGTMKSLSHQKQNEEPSKMETEHTKFQKAQYHCNDFSADVYASEVVENLLSSHLDNRSDVAQSPDPLNSKEVDEVEKANVCKSNGRKEYHSYVIENNYHSISESGAVSLEPQLGKSFDEALRHDADSSQVAGEVKKTRVCKKRGTKKQHSGKIKDGSSQGVGEVKKTVMCKKRGTKKLDGCKIKDHNLLDSSIIKTMDNMSCCKTWATEGGNSELQESREPRSIVQPIRQTGEILADDKQAPKGVRTVLYWLIKMGVLSPSDIMQYQSPRNSAVVKEGQITKAGILCKCCQKILSVSDFKRHAGFKVQKPSLNLFLKSGKPYISCQLQAWSAEYKLRKDDLHTREVDEGDKNDDACRFCADGGELICCDSCPATYHQACLYLQELPEDSWYCPNCSCAICNCVLKVPKDSGSIATVECSQCEQRYHETCIKERIRCDAIGYNMWFCGQKCLQVYTGLHSLIGVTNCMNDGLSWTILKCCHDDKKVHSAQKTALMAECNSKLAIALSIMEESFLPMLDPRTGNNILPLVLYNWRSNMLQVNYQGFYTVALERDDELFSVASIRVHGVTLAEIPLIATCFEQRLKGMCRRLMHAIEEMLKLLKVEMLVLSAIPGLVETWISTFGFQHINDDDKQKLCGLNLMIFPGATLLKKKLYEYECSELGNDDNSASSNLPSPSHNAADMIHQKTSSEATMPSSNSTALDLQVSQSLSTEQSAAVPTPVAGTDAPRHPFSSCHLSCPSAYTEQYSCLISNPTHLKYNGTGNNYRAVSTKNIEGTLEGTLEGTHETATEGGANDNSMIHSLKQKDPYIEALNFYKSALASI